MRSIRCGPSRNSLARIWRPQRPFEGLPVLLPSRKPKTHTGNYSEIARQYPPSGEGLVDCQRVRVGHPLEQIASTRGLQAMARERLAQTHTRSAQPLASELLPVSVFERGFGDEPCRARNRPRT